MGTKEDNKDNKTKVKLPKERETKEVKVVFAKITSKGELVTDKPNVSHDDL